MANNFLTVEEIAKESLLRFRNNLVMRQLVYTDHSSEFAQKGDSVQVKKPASFVANDFTSTISAQHIVEDKVSVKLDKISDVSTEISSKELTLNIQDFGTQVIEGAMQALAQKVDYELTGLYADIPYIAGTAGQTPSKLDHIAQARKVLNDNKVPFGNRFAVWDTEAEAKLLVIDSLVNAEKSGSTAALREASMGKVFGFDNFVDQNIRTHTSGTAATFNVAGTAGQSTLSITTATNAHTFKKGDIITVTGVTQKFAVTADVTVAATIATVSVSQKVATTFTAAAGALTANHVASIAAHKNAFAFVNRPMALPMGGAEGYVANYDGLSVRVTMGYTMSSKVNTISFDILYGVKTLQPELAVRVFGTSA